MERVLSSELRSYVGSRVELAGWLHHQRELSRVTFLLIRDRGGLAQVVLEEPVDLRPETVLEVEGEVVANEQAPGGVEVHDPTLNVVSEPVGPPPLELRRPRLKEQLPTLLDHAVLAWRHPRERAKLQIAAASVAGFREALGRLDFTEIQTPKIVASRTESGANVFTLDYFGRRAYLAQSPQFYKQIMVGALERVFEVGPAFRAEPHETGRHLAEYVSLDAELGFVTGPADVMAVARNAVAGMVDGVQRLAAPAVEMLEVELPEVPREIPVLHFAETDVDDVDLAPADERRLCEETLRDHGSEFVFVLGFPMAKRPFYTHPDPSRPGSSNGFDLLFRGLEIVTGGQRLHRYEDYVRALEDEGEPLEPYGGYLEAFRYGMPPHGGFALGLERWVARLVGARNIRETTLFPRDRTRLSP